MMIETTPGCTLPLAEQVAAHFRNLIFTRQLREGDLLPPTSQIANASQPVALRAYRQLQAEGLVHIRRSRGTVVTAGPKNQCLGLLLRPPTGSRGFGEYREGIISGLMRRAEYHGNVPRVYMTDPYAEPVERMIPPGLLGDLARNDIRGLFVDPHLEGRAVLDWLRDRDIPTVLLTSAQEGSRVAPDQIGVLRDGIRWLTDNGCRRLLAHSSFRGLQHESIFESMKDLGAASLAWQYTRVHTATAVSVGTSLASQWLEAPPTERADGILLTDDWLALGFYVQLRSSGIRVPEDVRLVIGCHRSQLIDVFDGCDLLLLEPETVIDRMIELMHRRIADPEAPPEVVTVPHKRLPHKKG